MKANELMIGDWVQSFGEPHKIIGIRTDTPYPYIKTDMSDTWYEWGMKDLADGITLTPEILEKNGFKDTIINIELDKDNVFKWYDFYGYCVIIILKANQIIIQHDSRTLLHMWYNNFVSVHEVQHALRLCGIEKDIEI